MDQRMILMRVPTSIKSFTITVKSEKRDQSKFAFQCGNGKVSGQDVVAHLASLAERGAGYEPRKIGWLTWFGHVLRGDKELFQKLRHEAEYWPPLEREIFEYYYVDHLALDQIVVIVGCTAKAFHAHLLFIQRRLREMLVREVLAELKETPNQRWVGRLRCRKCGTCSQQTISPVMSLV
jgi:hypothetical protein